MNKAMVDSRVVYVPFKHNLKSFGVACMGVGFCVARSTISGNAKASICRTGNRKTPTHFDLCPIEKTKFHFNCSFGSVEQQRIYMKNKFFLLAFCFVAMSLSVISCSSGSDDPEPTLTVGTSSLSFTSEGESQSFSISSNTSWTITGNQSWLTVSPASGTGSQSVVVYAQSNQTTSPRTCILNIVTSDGSKRQSVSIEQQAATATLLVNGSTSASLNFGSTANESQSVNVTANLQWNVTNIPDWIRVSPSNGSGNSSLSITTISENNTSSVRQATITVQSSGATANIEISQAAGKPVCYVEPANVTALYNQVCFELKATGKVNTFKLAWFDESELSYYTEKEITDAIESLDENKFADDYIYFPNGLYANTKYYICSIAYDEKGNAGDLRKVSFKTLPYITYNDDAYVSISDLSYGDSGFKFTMTKEAYCDTYHMICGNLPIEDSNLPGSVYAFEINYYKNNKKKHWLASNHNLEIQLNYPNSHTFYHDTNTIPYYPVIAVYGWGVFKDGSVSSDILGISWNTSESDAKTINAPKPERKKAKAEAKVLKYMGNDMIVHEKKIK